MTDVADSSPSEQPVTAEAAVIVLGRRFERRHGTHELSSLSEVLSHMGATSSRVYEVAKEFEALLPGLVRPPGRPMVPSEPDTDETCAAKYAVSKALLKFLSEHPGVRHDHDERNGYNERYSRHVIALKGPGQPGEHLSVSDFAEACVLPLETVRQWLSGKRKREVPDAPQDEDALPPDALPRGAIALVVALWRHNRGMRLTTFRELLRTEHSLVLSFKNLRQILRLTGDKPVSKPHRRKPDAEAIRGQMKRFFPGAQWSADGSQLVISFNGERFVFNWELVVDVATGALVGFDISDTEDSEALCNAFDHAVATTGMAPVAILTDNLPANHSVQVVEHLDKQQTMDMLSTPYRPENKATVEGAFGLFKQYAPPLEINATSRREMMREVLRLTMTAYAQGRNHVKRPGLGKKSAAEVHENAEVTDQEREQARIELAAINDRIKHRQAHERQRLDPVALSTLERVFGELGMSDPEGQFIPAMAKHGLKAVLRGIAIFKPQRDANKRVEHPERYLLGIITNVAHRAQHDAMYEHLIELRLQAEDDMLRPLLDEQQDLNKQHPEPSDYLEVALQHALSRITTIDRTFWRSQFLARLAKLPRLLRRASADNAARQVATSFNLDKNERQAFIARLAELVVPLPG